MAIQIRPYGAKNDLPQKGFAEAGEERSAGPLLPDFFFGLFSGLIFRSTFAACVARADFRDIRVRAS
jgi:hypothetical protein